MKEFFEYMRKQNVWALMTAFALGTMLFEFLKQFVFNVVYPVLAYYLQFTGLFSETAILGQGTEQVQVSWGAAVGMIIVIALSIGTIWFIFWLGRMFEKKVMSKKFFSKKKK